MSQLPDGPLALDMTPAEFQDRVDAMMGIRAHPSDVIAAANGNSRPKPPKSLLGYVQDAAFGSILYGDELETVADVQWPQSVQTFAQMRRDAKLAAILDGYALQLRRAQWQLDGTGCRPEVVKLVADDMGLAAKDHDEPGPARTKGVSWNDHLRSALGMLWAGHAGFELEADVSSGQARLVGLWERPQHTIVSIHIEPKRGQFTGISQELARGPFDEPELKADRLAWYAHDPEGAGWFGSSLMRPSFAPWLFKRECMRILATTSRRVGMGIPTVKWANTANPTPQQFSEAQKAITSARVGDTAGVTLPPGAMMELVGMTGSTPDTLGFLKWLDQQMAMSALMQHLDLGQTQTGSRALGESFIDSWTLALEAIGEEIADAATRQVAARIVAWNWGDGEPVPRVVVSGIGSRREVTAQSLQLLLDSGALAADPALEEWVRREHRLPARTTPRPVQVQNPPRPNGNRPAQQPAAVEAATQPVPGWEGSIGPSPAEYDQPHVYARDVTSGAGNCVCGRGLGDELHVQGAPGVPVPVEASGPVRYEQPALPIAGSDVVAHLPGRHNQQTHGRRYGPGGDLLRPKRRSSSRRGRSQASGQPAKGRDITEDLDYAALTNRRGTYRDAILGDIAAAQGFDGKPRVADEDEVDRIVAGGGRELFRGIPEAEYVEQFKTGDYWPGFGIYGAGTYAVEDRAGARNFANGNDENVLRMVLPKNARTTTLAELGQMQRADGVDVRNAADSARGFALSDPGRYAAAKGFDAYLATDRFGAEIWVVVNRTAVTVQR